MNKPVDVLVLGAGVIGVTTAYTLASQGLSVTIMDRAEGPAEGTSFANGAQLSYAYTDALAQPSLIRKIPGLLAGFDPAFRIRPSIDPAFVDWTLRFLRNCTNARFTANTIAALHLGLESRRAMHALLERHPLTFEHKVSGKMLIYRDAPGLARAGEVAAIKRAEGIEQYVLSPAEAIAIEPALGDAGKIEGVLWSPQEEVGDPYLFCRALLEVLRRNYGVSTMFNSVAKTITRETGELSLTTADGNSISAHQIVVCLGPDAPAFLATLGIRAPVLAMKGYSFTAPLGDNAPAVSLTDTARKIVFCRLGSALRVAGLAELGIRDTRIDKDRLQALVSGAAAGMPRAARYDDAGQHWAGLRPMTPNSLPIIRQLEPGVFANIGHGMLGWTFALASALRLAALVQADHKPHSV
jgi:D-amino-acid dehydrogenase